MGLVGLRHCPACREERIRPLPCGGGVKHHPCTILLWSFPCLMAGRGGHLCPSHLVAPDILKKGSLVWIVEPWVSLALRTHRLLEHGGTWPSSQQDGPSGDKPLSMHGSRVTRGCSFPWLLWERKCCFPDSPSLG